ncbi:hypothetical protein CLU91_4218 [Janthinobacterium sp. 64]|nr:hypothetical protein CLU91_4218 [Janthinobacterium sp. 64]
MARTRNRMRAIFCIRPVNATEEVRSHLHRSRFT